MNVSDVLFVLVPFVQLTRVITYASRTKLANVSTSTPLMEWTANSYSEFVPFTLETHGALSTRSNY